MSVSKKRKLAQNFTRIFWVKALMHVKALNMVSTLFFLHRGISMTQIFYTSVIWSATQLLFEVPSSYMADKWGRKNTIILGVFFSFLFYVLLLFAYDVLVFYGAFICLAISYAFISGTDEALIYDTSKELGREKESLKKLGNLYSAQRLFKIFTPAIAVLIAKDLVDWQFTVLIGIDIIATVFAFIAAVRLTEANHHMDLEEKEAGIIHDAWKIIKGDRGLRLAILSRTFLFIPAFIIWRYAQKYFIDIGVSIVTVGFAWSGFQLLGFIASRMTTKIFPGRPLSTRINILNRIGFGILGILLFLVFVPIAPYLTLACYILFAAIEVSRWPLYGEYYNKRSKSFNRATTLSLSNYIKSVLDIPFLLIVAWGVAFSDTWPFVICIILGIISIACVIPIESKKARIV